MTHTLVLYSIIIALLLFILAINKQHKETTKDLLDRVMAKDFIEYKENTQPIQTFEPIVVDEKTEYWNEIEDNKV